MKTVIIQIGNSDDKLSQKEWSEFVRDIGIFLSPTKVHFFSTSPNTEEWQNACWVVEIEDYDYEAVKKNVSMVGAQYWQESIVWIVGETELI